MPDAPAPDPAVIPPDAFVLIIGAMKCGTSSLYDYLSRHPQICAAFTKEPEYFSRNQQHRSTLDDYRSLWPFRQKAHRYVIEASTGYSKYPAETGVPRRIYEAGIRPRFLYILREPLTRIESHVNSCALMLAGWRSSTNSS